MNYELVFSATGRTQAVADLLTTPWGEGWQKVDLSAPGTSMSLTAGDLCLVAVSSYGGRVPALAREALLSIQGNGAQAILAVVFGNRAIDDTLLELRDILTGQGFVCRAALEAVAEHSIMPRFGAGRPDEADKKELLGFMEQIKAGLEGDTLPQKVTVPGNFPYCEVGGSPMHPKGNNKCTKCELCVQRCPVGAISADDPKLTDEAKCITCMRCVAICPEGARSLPTLMLKAAEVAMAGKLGGHKPNALYIS